MTSDSHTEHITCPNCSSIQEATVKHSIPWCDYTHCCTECEYWITESDWSLAIIEKAEEA
jgi:C4-type Zn-finger protein